MENHSVLDEPWPTLLQEACDGMMLIDRDRLILAMNPAMERLAGLRARDVVGRTACGALFQCQDVGGCSLWLSSDGCPGLKAMREFTAVSQTEYRLLRADGRRIVVSASYTPIHRGLGRIAALVIVRDVTDQKRREGRLLRQAMNDPLTGLLNRAAFAQAFQKELKRASRYGRPLAVAMADLDGFKPYNDAYGHPAGDQMLRTVASLLKSASRAADTVGRYGGDEFVLAMPETDAETAVRMLGRMRSIIELFPFARVGKVGKAPDVPIRISFGAAVFPEEGTTAEDLLRKADYRLLEAKTEGGNRVKGPSGV